jgi:LPPG:FO 2-phospho-L-lactate transferase
MHVTVVSGGIGGARFLRGLLHVLDAGDQVTVIGNTADDIWLFGLRVCPDLDTLMYTLGGGIDDERGWGRAGETWQAKQELAAYGAQPDWFGLGDRDLATHLLRTQMLTDGQPLSTATRRLSQRWLSGLHPAVRLLPMSDDPVETHVLIADATAPDGQRTVHFQEYWVRLHAEVPALGVLVQGQAESSPAPGVVEAVDACDVVLLPPSNPVVSIGTVLGVPGIGAAVRRTAAPVVGVSPIVGGRAVRGMAGPLLRALGVDVTAAAVAGHLGARSRGGFLDGWLVDESDAGDLDALTAGIRARAVPLLMRDLDATAAMAAAALDLALR